MFTNKQRWRNYGLWVGIIALVPMIVQAFSHYNIIISLPDNYQKIAYAVLSLLVLLGVINDPNTVEHNGYIDDKEDTTDEVAEENAAEPSTEDSTEAVQDSANEGNETK